VALGQEQPVRAARDGNVKEVMQVPEVRELGVEPINDALKEYWRRRGEDDVVDVQQ
jgi:hypothetical protein